MQWSQVRSRPDTIYMIYWNANLNQQVVWIWKFKVCKDVRRTMANMNNVKFKFNDFNGFAIGMPPVAWQLVVTVIYWPRVEIFKQMSSESDYITFRIDNIFWNLSNFCVENCQNFLKLKNILRLPLSNFQIII